MATRVTGLTSGLDTEALVSAMVMNYKAKQTKAEQGQASLQYKLDALKAVNKDVYSLFSAADKMRWSSAYTLKGTSVSDTTKAKVSASSTAVNGTQTLEVKELAQAAYLTGDVVKSKGTLSGSSKLSDIYTDKGTFDGGSISVTQGGKETTITLSEGMTANELAAKLKDAGLNANFDEKNGRFYVSSKESGADNGFSIVANDSKGLQSLKALGLYYTDKTTVDSYSEWAGRYEAGMEDPDTWVPSTDWTDFVDAQYASKVITYEGRAESLATQFNNARKAYDMNQTEMAKFFEKADGADPDSGGFHDSKEILDRVEELKSKRDTDFAAYRKEIQDKNDKGEDITRYEFETDKMSEDELKAFNELSDKIKVLEDNGKELEKYEKANGENQEVMNKVRSKVHIEKDADNKEIASALKDGDTNYDLIKDEVDADNKSAKESLSDNLRKRVLESQSMLSSVGDKGAAFIPGSDAVINLNGAEYTSSGNSFSINGLNIEVTGKTKVGEPITITTNTDTQGIYDKIKDFLTQYNDTINKMSKMYNAASSKGYDPLTADQKAAMSETDINLWETKIKDSILRRDSTVGGIINSMTNAMTGSFDINGKTYTLSSFGIGTLGYFAAEKNEKYAYHIDGDEDDGATSGKTDKLMAAIMSDPEAVIGFFQKLSSNLYDSLNAKMKSSSLSSAYTIYNDKEMASEYSSYTKTISKWQNQVSTMEEYYYKKYAAMESTLTKLQGQTSQMSSYFG